MAEQLVEVRNLRIELPSSTHDIVDEIDFDIAAGEILGVVGESGSGKTTIGTALLAFTRRGARITGGSVRIGGCDVLALGPDELRAARGSLVAYIPQDPSAALNPSIRIGVQIREVLDAHRIGSDADRSERIAEVLAEVGLPSTAEFLRRYPHQLSGGQKQRVCIAMAFAARPKVVVLDEPTTGLDVSTQAQVLETIRQLCGQHDVAALYVTHDLAVVGSIARRLLVMYAGRVVEQGLTADILTEPAHPYSRGLIRAIPDLVERNELRAIGGRAPAPGARPAGCSFAPRCPEAVASCHEVVPAPVAIRSDHLVRCPRVDVAAPSAVRAPAAARQAAAPDAEPILSVVGLDSYYGSRQVLHDVTFSLAAAECLAVVGESGSGKTTLARTIIGLQAPTRGLLTLRGTPLAARAADRSAEVRRSLQYVFQSPYSSLNPRRTIGQSIAVPIEQFFSLSRHEVADRVAHALERVSLSPDTASRYPDQLSGGERQRVAIARALVAEPDVLLCDEITSALDVSVQASIIELLDELRRRDGLSLLFVTHNLPLVHSIADQVAVMTAGRIVELGTTDQVLHRPLDAYTRSLVADTPSLTHLQHRQATSPPPPTTTGDL